MKRLLSSLAVLAIFAACSGPTGVDEPVRLNVTATAVPTSPCSYCPFGPESFVRSTATRAQAVKRTFDADPSLIYDLVIVHESGRYTETDIILNGVLYRWDSRWGGEFRQSLLLDQDGTNDIWIKVYGPQGSSVIVYIETLGDQT